VSYGPGNIVYNVHDCVSVVRSQHLLRVGLVYLNLISKRGGGGGGV
jgi:hypothetical protein